jgi:hypothetical protein
MADLVQRGETGHDLQLFKLSRFTSTGPLITPSLP